MRPLPRQPGTPFLGSSSRQQDGFEPPMLQNHAGDRVDRATSRQLSGENMLKMTQLTAFAAVVFLAVGINVLPQPAHAQAPAPQPAAPAAAPTGAAPAG